jgi:protein-S-isoprenylcysteine O-methyltransferase Ste14
MRSRFMVRTGQFLFRYRALLFPAIFISILFIYRPRPYLPPAAYRTVIAAGLVLTLLGEAVRILTIGLDYIERGGQKGSPFASRLVRGGIYSHVRNPMYVGNLMIAVGIGLYSGAPLVMVTVLPLFFFFYYAIIAAEENFLRGKFGAEYDEFCKTVSRLWPHLSGIGDTISNSTFNWRRPLAKDNGTAYYTFLALALVPLWRMHFLGDLAGFDHYKPAAILLAAVLTPTYIVVRVLAKTGRLA